MNENAVKRKGNTKSAVFLFVKKKLKNNEFGVFLVFYRELYCKLNENAVKRKENTKSIIFLCFKFPELFAFIFWRPGQLASEGLVVWSAAALKLYYSHDMTSKQFYAMLLTMGTLSKEGHIIAYQAPTHWNADAFGYASGTKTRPSVCIYM